MDEADAINKRMLAMRILMSIAVFEANALHDVDDALFQEVIDRLGKAVDDFKRLRAQGPPSEAESPE